MTKVGPDSQTDLTDRAEEHDTVLRIDQSGQLSYENEDVDVKSILCPCTK